MATVRVERNVRVAEKTAISAGDLFLYDGEVYVAMLNGYAFKLSTGGTIGSVQWTKGERLTPRDQVVLFNKE